MTHESYLKYFSAIPKGKKAAAQLTSSNSLVGNTFSLRVDTKKNIVKIYNKYNHCVSEIEDEDAKKIILWKNKGLQLVALMSFVAYNSIEDNHFAEFLILAYPKNYEEAYKNFTDTVSGKLANGSRPDIKLDKFECAEIEKNNGNYKIEKFLPKPKLDKGCAIVKYKQGIMERIIEAGRQKKIGCYIGSILFLLIIIGLIVLLFSQIIS